MKQLLVLCSLLSLLLGCAGRTTRQPLLAANGKIQEWGAAPSGDEWTATVWYDVHNTGTQEITGFSVHITIDVEGSKTVIADCWGPSGTVDDYQSKKVSPPIPAGETERCVIVLVIPYKPMRVAIALEKFK
jgi:hypothetical protein